MYVFLVALGYCVAYLFLFFLYPLFFKNIVSTVTWRSLYSVAYVIFLYIFISLISTNISDVDLSNRILHIFGGGFLSFFVCFLVVKDTGLRITKFRFFTFSFLIVVALGVGNEIFEYFLQNYSSLSFAKTANDTWMDLISNCVGALIAAACFVPFIKFDK